MLRFMIFWSGSVFSSNKRGAETMSSWVEHTKAEWAAFNRQLRRPMLRRS